jgi:flagellar hook assembly protein FlgD
MLMQNYPNPFNPECWIPYALSERCHVVIKIYTITGQLIRTLDLGMQEPGTYISQDRAAYWDGLNDEGEEVASGVYFYRLQAGDKVSTKKMVVLK